MTEQAIRTRVLEGGVALLTLSRPGKRNAISIEMRREISACLASWGDDAAIGAVVLTGDGAAFSAGFDLDEFKQPERFDELFETSTRYHRDVWAFPKPVVAAVNGPAMGGGFDLATLCDLRVASTRATFGHPRSSLALRPCTRRCATSWARASRGTCALPVGEWAPRRRSGSASSPK